MLIGICAHIFCSSLTTQLLFAGSKMTNVLPFFCEGHCYGCRNDGKSGLKHPNNSDAYSGGHLDGCLPFGLNDSRSKYDGLNVWRFI